MNQEGSHEPQPKPKEVDDPLNEARRDLFRGYATAIIQRHDSEAHELPPTPELDRAPYAFRVRLDEGMTKVALNLDQTAEKVERSEVIYSEAHTSPDIPGLVIPPEIIIDIHVRVALPPPETPPVNFIPPTELDKHIIYCIQQVSENLYSADASMDYRDPRIEMDAESYVTDKEVDTDLLQLETLRFSADELDNQSTLTYEESIKLIRSPMKIHDLDAKEIEQLGVILKAIRP